MKKAQVAMEFIVVAGFAMFMFTSLFFALQNRLVYFDEENTYNSLGEVANLVSTELNLASQLGKGYSRDFYVPTTLNGLEYNLTLEGAPPGIVKTDLIVEAEGLQYIMFLEDPLIGTINKGKNTVKHKGGSLGLRLNTG